MDEEMILLEAATDGGAAAIAEVPELMETPMAMPEQLNAVTMLEVALPEEPMELAPEELVEVQVHDSESVGTPDEMICPAPCEPAVHVVPVPDQEPHAMATHLLPIVTTPMEHAETNEYLFECTPEPILALLTETEMESAVEATRCAANEMETDHDEKEDVDENKHVVEKAVLVDDEHETLAISNCDEPAKNMVPSREKRIMNILPETDTANPWNVTVTTPLLDQSDDAWKNSILDMLNQFH